MKYPECVNNQFSLLEELVKKIPDAVPEMRTALRDALLEMAVAYRINPDGEWTWLLKVRTHYVEPKRVGPHRIKTRLRCGPAR